VLSQNYPNPFNPETTIEYQVPIRIQVIIKVYNLMGEEIVTLVNEHKEAGYHRIRWDGMDYLRRRSANGVYIYAMKAGNFAANKKLIIMK
jgi:flagellar hook assembly protein FlgD